MRDVGDEVPVLPTIFSPAPALQISAVRDPQSLQRREAFYPLRQGSDALAAPDLQLFKGGQVAQGFWKAGEPWQLTNVELA